MKNLLLILFTLLPLSLLSAEQKTSSIKEVCQSLKPDIFVMHDAIKEMDNMDTSEFSEEMMDEFMEMYLQAIDIQLANTKMYSDLDCKNEEKNLRFGEDSE